MKFSIKDFFSKCDQIRSHFLCSNTVNIVQFAYADFFKFERRIQNPVEHLRWSFFVKIVTGFQALTTFAKSSMLDVRLGSEYAPKFFSLCY